jgi:hypothetical protein
MAEAPDSGRDVGDSVDAGRGELLTVLLRHEVRFVVIGGAAIQSHGRRYVTEDIDLTPDTERANLQRLADALNELECRLVTDPADPTNWVSLPADYFTPRSLLAASVWNVATRHGLLDLSFTPAGSRAATPTLRPTRSPCRQQVPRSPFSWRRSTMSTRQSELRIDRRTAHISPRLTRPANGNDPLSTQRRAMTCGGDARSREKGPPPHTG